MVVGFATTCATSDFIVDCLEHWWNANKQNHQHIRQLVINLDNGPQNSSHRTQFMKRIVDFVAKEKIAVELAYYPPYHSKYNPIEHVF